MLLIEGKLLNIKFKKENCKKNNKKILNSFNLFKSKSTSEKIFLKVYNKDLIEMYYLSP